MSGAVAVLQQAAVAALRADPVLAEELSGVFDGPPPRARFPYLAIGDALEGDWSTKTEIGREIRLPLTLWDEEANPTRLNRLMAAAGDALAPLSGVHQGWRIVSVQFLRSAVTRTAAGPWAGLIEHRIRLMAED